MWIPLGLDYHIKLFIFTIILWDLWTVRNKMGIDGSFLARRMKCFIIKIFMLLQKWRILLKEQEA